jgi:protein-disulfide isomerase
MAKKEEPFSFITMPLAVIIAGGLIAVAIYLSNADGQESRRAATDSTPAPAVAGEQGNQPPQQPPQPEIGDIADVDTTDHVRGASDATVTIIEYSDFECSFCRRFHPTMKQVIEEYPNDVRWVYRDFVLGMFPNSRIIAMASECAGEQGVFWEMADAIFDDTTTDKSTVSGLAGIAETAGVPNIRQFEACVEDEKYADKIDRDTADARAAGGRGTPYSVAIGPDGSKTAISGAQPFEQVKATIDSLLE